MIMFGKMQRFFIDEKREKARQRKGRSLLADIFWYSDSSDYPRFRVIFNFFVGLGLCLFAYYAAWRRLNFLEFNVYTSLAFQVGFVLAASLAFAKNPVFRCAIICVCLGALGRTGQGLFSLFIVERLTEGPVDNLMHNFQMTSSIVVCHLEVQSRITAKRITLAAGPIEEFLERNLGKGISAGQKLVHSLKALISPLGEDLKTSSEEDDTLAAVIDNAQALSDRQFLVEGGKAYDVNGSLTVFGNGASARSTLTPTVITERPIWARYRTALARAVARRFVHRCETVFSATVKSCHEKLENIQPGEMTDMSKRYCEMGSRIEGDNPLPPDLDDQMEAMENVSQQIEAQLKLNLHFQAIEEPANDRIRALNEVKAEIQADIDYFKIIINTVKDLLVAVLVLLLYWIFREAVQSITNYLGNADYRNHFVTDDFWFIDEHRRLRGRPNFGGRLDDELLEKYHLVTPFQWPTLGEMFGGWLPLIRWLLILIVALIVVVFDYFYYRILTMAIKFGKGSSGSHLHGEHTLNIDVTGDGPIAQVIKDILNFNFTQTERQTLPTTMCYAAPRAPDWTYAAAWVGTPLAMMFFMQMVFNFIISRVTLLYIIGFVFRKRAVVRAKFLYRKLIADRSKGRRRAAKIGLIPLEEK